MTHPEWQHVAQLARTLKPAQARRYGFDRITVKAGLHYIKGNSVPYFSITATIYEGRRDVGGGMMQDEIAQFFPELDEVLPLHLSDNNGIPMHCAANGLYHLGFGEYSKLDLEVAAHHFRISVDDARRLRESIMSGSGHDPDAYANALAEMLPRWKQEAERAIAKLDELGE